MGSSKPKAFTFLFLSPWFSFSLFAMTSCLLLCFLFLFCCFLFKYHGALLLTPLLSQVQETEVCLSVIHNRSGFFSRCKIAEPSIETVYPWIIQGFSLLEVGSNVCILGFFSCSGIKWMEQLMMCDCSLFSGPQNISHLKHMDFDILPQPALTLVSLTFLP